MIRKITPRNFLSFGPEFPGIELRPLNVLIGANGCGKSNLIEAVAFMRAAPKDFQEVTRRGGGVGEWIWKGQPHHDASVEWVLSYDEVDESGHPKTLSHYAAFFEDHHAFSLSEERIDEVDVTPVARLPYYQYKLGTYGTFYDGPQPEPLPVREEVDLSVLALVRDPWSRADLSLLAQDYEHMRIYREWVFGRDSKLRDSQRADQRKDILAEDFSNLGLFLNRLQSRFPVAKRAIIENLKDLYEGVTDFNISIDGGTVQIYFTEGDFSIPATRLSDGTIRYLCLLAILCDPEPPPLICLEEPELGLHPDILANLAKLLLEASTRTQLIVTTHSEVLVDFMTETPECVVVCSKEQGQTVMERLNADDLKVWLERYRLGQLWSMGQIGGNRW